MTSIQIVDPIYIHQIWGILERFFERSVQNSIGDTSPEQWRMMLANGQYTLFVVLDDENKIIGTFAVSISNQANDRVLFVGAMGGKAVFSDQSIQQFEDWARSQGVTKVRAWAKDSQARLFRRKLGLNVVTHVVEKDL
jgi:hypothetical protein